MTAAESDALKVPRPLTTGNFRRIAENGFGDGHNSYPFSCAWYDGHVYIGTNRCALPILLLRSPFDIPFVFPPVPTPTPEDWQLLDLRAQIWRYDLDACTWEQVFLAPRIPGHGGLMIPLAVGFRCMEVFQGTSDSRKAIYSIPQVGRNAFNTTVLRCDDGVNFEPIGPPLINGEVDDFGSYRALKGFKGYLFAAPMAAKPPPLERVKDKFVSFLNTAENSAVRCTKDPASGEWHLSSQIGFGDRTNTSIVDMAICGDYLYAGTLNPRQGFQLWRTDAEGPPPHRWTKVLDHGADRGPLNEAVLCMTAFNGALYIGTCIQNGGHDRTNNIGPAAAEVIRVFEDGSWDLVMGAPRLTRQGLKVPTSGLGPGFQNLFGVYMWRMCAHDGALYVGTHDLLSFAPYSDPTLWPESVRKIFQGDRLRQFLDIKGGAELWRTVDGDDWQPVTVNGFDNFYNYGFRAMLSTPRGIFIGAANPFGPEVAIQGPGGWRYQANPRGGIEVWHGTPECTDGSGIVKADKSPQLQIAAIPCSLDLLQRSDAREDQEAWLPDTGTIAHSLRGSVGALMGACALDPFVHESFSDDDLTPPAETLEEELNIYFGEPGNRCIGYWKDELSSPISAHRAVISEYVAFGESGTGSNILLLGDSSLGLLSDLLERLEDSHFTVVGSRLSEIWAATQSTRVNILQPGRERFASEIYDSLIWIEGPSAEGQPEAFSLALQFLRPGGHLFAMDLVCTPKMQLTSSVANHALQTRDLLESTGFEKIKIVDLTDTSWGWFYNHSRHYAFARMALQLMSEERYAKFLAALPGAGMAVEAYLMLSAFKKQPETNL